MAKSICKYCFGSPKYYFSIFKGYLLAEVQTKIMVDGIYQKHIKRIQSSFWNGSRFFKDLGHLKFALSNSYVPVFHMKYDVPEYKDYTTGLAMCDCAKTHWLFNKDSIKCLPEILNRKGRSFYSKKLIC